MPEIRLGEVDDKEQKELKSMFGMTPVPEDYTLERELELSKRYL